MLLMEHGNLVEQTDSQPLGLCGEVEVALHLIRDGPQAFLEPLVSVFQGNVQDAMDWLHYAGQFHEGCRLARGKGIRMADPNHPRRLADDFKRQIVDLHYGGKPVGEIVADYDLGRSTVRR